MPESPERTALLLPIKDLRNAKQRLAGVLSASERRDLAEAMPTQYERFKEHGESREFLS
jgi:hypothetical protein